MRKLLLVSVSLLIAGAASVPLQAKASQLKWMAGPPGLPSGSTFAVVSGDPGKPGRFAIRAKFPADYAVPPHWHPTDEKVTVVSGKLHYGMNDKVMSNAKTLTVGQSVTMKATMHHWVHAPGPAEIEVSGMGPFAITYVNPKDDPRTK